VNIRHPIVFIALAVLTFIIIGVSIGYLLWTITVVRRENLPQELPAILKFAFFTFLLGTFPAALSGLMFGSSAVLLERSTIARRALAYWPITVGALLGGTAGVAGLWASIGWMVGPSIPVTVMMGALPGAVSGAAFLLWQRKQLRIPNNTAESDARKDGARGSP